MKRFLPLVASLFVALSLCIPHTVFADDENESLNIEPQPLASALRKFSEQTGLQIGYAAELADGKESKGVEGVDDPALALDTLLASTGLEHRFVNDETVVIRSVAVVDTEQGGAEPGKAQPASSQVLMAQNQASANQNQSGQPNNNDDEVPLEIEEIIVTGTHIRGVESVGSSSMTFSREELDQTGFSTVEEFFESLPQNLAGITPISGLATGASNLAGFNNQGATSINLRGLGPGSTLVLFNGKRQPGNIRGQAVDVSSIPLSMVERVELVTGGRSAVYGSDAVAGVVNIVTVTELDGAETQVYYGESSAGGERFNFSQTFGRKYDRGGFALGYDYRDDQPLDATDTGVLAPSIFGLTPIPGIFHFRGAAEQHVGLFAGHFELTDKAELYADARFAADEYEHRLAYTAGTCCDVNTLTVTDSDQYSAVGGLRLDVGKNWQLDVSALYGVVDNTVASGTGFGAPNTVTSADPPPPATTESNDEAKLTLFSAVADGQLGALGSNAISAAIGVEFRDESYVRTLTTLSTSAVDTFENIDRDVLSLFGEVHLPLLNRNGQRLEVSLAGRYDDYSDFGDTFNPQLGIEWAPNDELTLRGSYSQAFRAPDLVQLAANTRVRATILDDPMAPGTQATVFIETGGNPNLQPEGADTYTLGIDWEPSERTVLSLSYFNVDYTDRIDQPNSGLSTTALRDELQYPGLVNRTPTPEELDLILSRAELFINSSGIPFDPATDDPFVVYSNIVIFDNRRNNVALESMDGLDVQVSMDLETNSGDWAVGLNGTYYLDFERNVTATAPTSSQLNEPGKPVDLKLRAHIGWARSAWNANAYVNYVDSYEDTFAATQTEIDSWTTVDLTVGFDGSEVSDSGFFDGLKATLGISNAFDEDPPAHLNNLFGIGYDAVNANALGRFVSLRLTKRW